MGALQTGLPAGISTDVALRALARDPAHENDSAQLGAFCKGVSEWAAGEGYVVVAREFAELVYHLAPAEADSALFAGRACRQEGAFDRAEQWYKHALGLARLHSDHSAYVLALIRRGVLSEQRGDSAEAYRLHLRAWKGAKRHKIRKLGAYAQHELLVMGVYTEPFEVAQEHARLALRLYGRFDERYPQLAHDTAFLWAWHGYFSVALPVFEAVLPYINRATERVQVIANIGRAAAATGDADRFFRAWDEVNDHKETAAEYRATALLNLGHGARTLRRVSLGRELAGEALQVASLRGEKLVAEHAQTLLQTMGMAGEAPDDRDKPPTAEMLEMSERLIGRLRRNQP
jgi:tetratricopeptide (TPR) repeat protein